jgi:hypothetical protein
LSFNQAAIAAVFWIKAAAVVVPFVVETHIAAKGRTKTKLVVSESYPQKQIPMQSSY